MSATVATVLSDGQAIGLEHTILSIDVRKEVNRIPYAAIVFVDGDLPGGKLPLADSGLFAPGREIEILLRRGNDPDTSIFKGLVFRLGIDMLRRQLTVEARDKALALAQGRRSRIFAKASDGDAIAEILRDANLTAGEIPAGGPAQDNLVQFNATDWDFIVTRADANGLVVLVEEGVVGLRPIPPSGSAVRTITLGPPVSAVELELDAGRQHPAIEAVAWDAGEQQATAAAEAEAVSLAQGTTDAAGAGDALGLPKQRLSHLAELPGDELQAWADARMRRTRMAMIRGRIAHDPITDVKPADLVTLQGFGDIFNGTAMVTGTRQHLSGQSEWRTDLQFGLSPTPFAAQPDIQDVDAGGLLPAVRGLQVGIVADYEEDSALRVKVAVPALAGDGETAIWARLLSPDAGSDRGVFFRPEKGDEVVIGFLGNDPRQPVILGSLFGSKTGSPKAFGELSEKNVGKGIVSRLGAALTIADDDDPVLTLLTPKASIAIDDKEGTLTVRDQHGNKVTLGEKGVEIVSAKDLVLDASYGKVTIKGQSVDVA